MSAWLQVTEMSAVGEARRRARVAATLAKLDETRIEHAGLVASEMSTNLVKHAGGGQFLEGVQPDGSLGLVAIDSGPGISDPDRMMEDGVSTVGSLGVGLGAMRRLSDAFDLHTENGAGTVATARIGELAALPWMEIAALRLNSPGSTDCGDAFAAAERGGRSMILVCDGLGHGKKAAEAADAITDAFFRAREFEPSSLLGHLNNAATPTRGGVATVCAVPRDEGYLFASGVGNVSGLICGVDGVRRLISRDGRLGGRVTARTETYPFENSDTLILHTDGLRTLRDLGQHRALFYRKPLTIAAKLIRDEARGNDDACVLVARLQS